jgi:hypothetical protein
MRLPGFSAETSLYKRPSFTASAVRATRAPGGAKDAISPASACKNYGDYLVCTEACDGDPWCLLSCYYANCT